LASSLASSKGNVCRPEEGKKGKRECANLHFLRGKNKNDVFRPQESFGGEEGRGSSPRTKAKSLRERQHQKSLRLRGTKHRKGRPSKKSKGASHQPSFHVTQEARGSSIPEGEEDARGESIACEKEFAKVTAMGGGGGGETG